MTVPSLPSGYDERHHIQAGRPDCHITVGFNQQHQHIPQFIVQLHYRVGADPTDWVEIARMDHNETSVTGHDVYQEGLHVDIHRETKSTVHLQVGHGPLPRNIGSVIRGCGQYLRREATYFIEVYEEQRPPGSPPNWRPDGGGLTHTLISLNPLPDDMSQESPVEDAISFEELDEILAEATGTTPEEIRRGAEELEIAPPWEAEIVEE